MELRQLSYFDAVARHRHFTRAAEEMHVAQPALSQQILRLEAELGTQLLERTTRRVRLTDAGGAFHARVQHVLAELDAARQELGDFGSGARGRVALGAMQSLGPVDLPVLLGAFHARHPRVDVAVLEDTTATMLRQVASDELDVAFAAIDERDFPATELAVAELFEEALVVIAARDHPLAGRAALALSDIAGEPFISFKAGTGLRRAVERAGEGAGFDPSTRFETTDIGRVRAFASHGLGVSIVPESVATRPGPPVSAVPLDPPLRRRVGLYWRAGRTLAPAASALRDFALAELGRDGPAGGPSPEGRVSRGSRGG